MFVHSTFTSNTTSTCTVSGINGSVVAGVAAGTCTVVANQAGSANYAPAPPVTQDMPVVNGPAVISLNPNALSFGEQHIGSISQPITVVLSNTGGSTLTIESIVVSLNPGHFAVSGCGASLGADASCNLSVTFAPTATAARLGVVRVTGNAANSSQSVNLDGIGVLSNVPICTLSAVPASITRGRSSTLTASYSPAASYAWTGGTCENTTVATCTVAPGQTTTYSVMGSNGAESDTDITN